MGNKEVKYLSRLKKADKQLKQAEDDLIYIVEFMNRLKSITKNTKKLADYYHSDWLRDVDKYHTSDSDHYHPSAGQDGIWDILQEHYTAKLDMLQVIINDINQK